MTEEPRFLSATSILNDKVTNPEGEELGEISDLVMDLQAGRVAYAVLAVKEMNGKLLAIPWSMFSAHGECECLILEASRAMLEEAPALDHEAWPKFTPSHDWLALVYKHFGSDLYW
jgi:sporulation protein YlmC with PRC-barrel domain